MIIIRDLRCDLVLAGGVSPPECTRGVVIVETKLRESANVPFWAWVGTNWEIIFFTGVERWRLDLTAFFHIDPALENLLGKLVIRIGAESLKPG